jgi:hypothetical protein
MKESDEVELPLLLKNRLMSLVAYNEQIHAYLLQMYQYDLDRMAFKTAMLLNSLQKVKNERSNQYVERKQHLHR